MSSLRCVTLLVSLFLPVIKSTPIDNGVEGAPDIICGQSSLAISVFTRNRFEGHVFVKGRYNEPNCRQDETNALEAGIEVGFDACGVRRTRSANPQGIFVDVTVIVSFHPQFITKVDRAYHVQCFYMEADKQITAQLEVSMLTTQPYTAQAEMPSCTYSVLAERPDGPPVRYARVGDPVFHKWECESNTEQMFCMTVHSCTVDDGTGAKIQLLDENGCALDQYLIGNLEYENDLIALRESHVFKYADRPNLYFNCQIRLNLKDGAPFCQRAICSDPVRGRKRRQLDVQATADGGETDVDVNSNALTVLDIEQGEDDVGNYPVLMEPNGNTVCLRRDVMLIALISAAFFVMAATVAVCLLRWRLRGRPQKAESTLGGRVYR